MTDMRGVERVEGTVKFFNVIKGFGFVTRDGGGDVFIHANELKRSGIEGGVKDGERLAFDVVPVPDKGPKAQNVQRI